MSSREPDLAFEALAEVTNAHWEANRGELNIALKTIKQQTELEGYELATAIRDHAASYRSVMGDEVMMTPTALAKHWTRVEAEVKRPTGTNLTSYKDDECPTCGGDRMVLVGTRPAEQTRWMTDRKIEVPDESYELMAPCPDCNTMDITIRRYDGTVFRTPDAGRTRAMMEQ